MAYRQKLGRLGQTAPPTNQQFTIPSSTGGINSLENLMTMAPTDCIYCDNIMPSEYGLRLRKGYRQHAINVGVGDGESSKICTIVPFEGQLANQIADRLFAVTPTGIYDVTLFGDTAPSRVATFTDTTLNAGYGNWTEFTNDASDRFLFYADSQNGLHQYQESTGVWSVPSFTGPGFDVTNVAFVTAWKNRLWFIQEESGDAYYTDVDAIGGTVEKFTFGSKFQHGGELKCLYSWTIDGGAGIDDLLVAVSRGGDVLVYQGIDPQTDMTLVGSYFIGELPESRRIGVSYGGELYLLTTFGLTSIRDLLQGVPTGDIKTSPSAKISRFVRQAVQSGKDFPQWSLCINPSDGFMQIVTPYDQRKDAIQFNQNLLTQAWGRWRGVPVNCADTWNAEYYFGDREGAVYLYDGALDGTLLTGANLWTNTNVSTGSGWTDLGGAYESSGAASSESLLTNQLSQILEVGYTYTIRYVLSQYGGGQFSMRVGGVETPTVSSNGIYTETIVASQPDQVASLVASSSFIGRIAEVSVQRSAKLGVPISFSLLTSFQAPQGDISSYKRVGFIRTIGIASGSANLNVAAVYDYAIETLIEAPPDVPTQGSNVWDTARWDNDLWDFTQKGVSYPTGSLNMGRTIAIAVRGSSASRLNIIGWDISYTVGGFL